MKWAEHAPLFEKDGGRHSRGRFQWYTFVFIYRILNTSCIRINLAYSCRRSEILVLRTGDKFHISASFILSAGGVGSGFLRTLGLRTAICNMLSLSVSPVRRTIVITTFAESASLLWIRVGTSNAEQSRFFWLVSLITPPVTTLQCSASRSSYVGQATVMWQQLCKTCKIMKQLDVQVSNCTQLN